MERRTELQYIRVGLMTQIAEMQRQLDEIDNELGAPPAIRGMSEAGRQRVSDAQRKRWAERRQAEQAALAAASPSGDFGQAALA